MGASPLPLSIIADVTVMTASPQVASPLFNKGLIVGSSTAIPSYGTNPRVRTYLAATYSSAMLADGFTANSPEYIAAQIYFSQSPQPQSLSVGRQDLTAIHTAIPDAGNTGTGYVVGDIVGVSQGGATNGLLRVSAVGAGGAVTTLDTISGEQGTGYSVATALTATGGTGTGLKVDITAIGETPLQALQVCRTADPTWYCSMVTAATDADHAAISTWVQSQVGTTYFGTTSAADVLNGVAGNVLKTIYATGAKRTWMQYATTQGGLVPNQAYFVAAVMGQAMASNTQAPNSSFTEKFSGGVPLVGVVTEPNLTITQIGNIEGTSAGEGPNGNLFLNYANSFKVLEQGTMMAPETYFDQVLNLDVLASNIQYNIMNLLSSVPKIPQTDAGQQQLIQAVEAACAQAASTGFIAPGVWQGQTVLSVKNGMSLPSGFAVVSPKWSTQTAAQRAARIAPPIYVCLIEAGAVHFVTIAVIAQV